MKPSPQCVVRSDLFFQVLLVWKTVCELCEETIILREVAICTCQDLADCFSGLNKNARMRKEIHVLEGVYELSVWSSNFNPLLSDVLMQSKALNFWAELLCLSEWECFEFASSCHLLCSIPHNVFISIVINVWCLCDKCVGIRIWKCTASEGRVNGGRSCSIFFSSEETICYH